MRLLVDLLRSWGRVEDGEDREKSFRLCPMPLIHNSVLSLKYYPKFIIYLRLLMLCVDNLIINNLTNDPD